jgi:antitoxin HigA-1
MTTKFQKKKSVKVLESAKSSDALNFLNGLIGKPVTLGLLLNSLRLAEEETLQAFGEKLGVSRSHLLDIEKGRRLVSPARAALFAELLGYPKQHFIELSLQDLVAREGIVGKVRFDVA